LQVPFKYSPEQLIPFQRRQQSYFQHTSPPSSTFSAHAACPRISCFEISPIHSHLRCAQPNLGAVLFLLSQPFIFTAHHHLHSPPFPPSMSRAWSLHSDFPSMSTGDSSNHSLIYSPGFAPIRLDTPVVGSLAGVCLVRRA